MKFQVAIVLVLVVAAVLALNPTTASGRDDDDDMDTACRKLAKASGKTDAELSQIGHFFALYKIKSQEDCNYWCKRIERDVALEFADSKTCCCATKKNSV